MVDVEKWFEGFLREAENSGPFREEMDLHYEALRKRLKNLFLDSPEGAVTSNNYRTYKTCPRCKYVVARHYQDDPSEYACNLSGKYIEPPKCWVDMTEEEMRETGYNTIEEWDSGTKFYDLISANNKFFIENRVNECSICDAFSDQED